MLQTILLFIVSSCAEIGFPHALDVESPALDVPSACPPRVHAHPVSSWEAPHPYLDSIPRAA